MKATISFFILIFTVMASFSTSLAQDKNNFVIRGNTGNVNNGIIRLSYYDMKKWRYDSTTIHAGKFALSGYISEPCKAELSYYINPQQDYTTSLWLERGEIKIYSDSFFQHIRIIGGKVNRDDSILAYSKLPIKKHYQSLLDTLDNLKSKDSIEAFREKIYPYLDEIKRADFDFFAAHPNSPVTGYYLMPYLPELSLPTLKNIYARFNPSMRSSLYGGEIKKRIALLSRIDTGHTAPLFCGVNYPGNTTICLQRFKGNYVLLDFWGSWCLPCRKQTPHLIELFSQYKNRGFIVIGIADDDENINAWKQAIKKDGSDIWYNILDGKIKDKNGQVNASASITSKFGVNMFPTKILIDKEGMVIGRYTGAEAEGKLDEKLLELFK